MATTKAAATKKKTTATKRAPQKKTAAKKAPQKQKVASFKMAESTSKFTSFRLTRQTLYWVIIVALIIFAQLWIIKLQVDISTLLDQQQAQLLDE